MIKRIFIVCLIVLSNICLAKTNRVKFNTSAQNVSFNQYNTKTSMYSNSTIDNYICQQQNCYGDYITNTIEYVEKLLTNSRLIIDNSLICNNVFYSIVQLNDIFKKYIKTYDVSITQILDDSKINYISMHLTKQDQLKLNVEINNIILQTIDITDDAINEVDYSSTEAKMISTFYQKLSELNPVLFNANIVNLDYTAKNTTNLINKYSQQTAVADLIADNSAKLAEIKYSILDTNLTEHVCQNLSELNPVLFNATICNSCNDIINKIIANDKIKSIEIKSNAVQLQIDLVQLKYIYKKLKELGIDKTSFGFGTVYWKLYDNFEKAITLEEKNKIILQIQSCIKSEINTKSRKLKFTK